MAACAARNRPTTSSARDDCVTATTPAAEDCAGLTAVRRRDSVRGHRTAFGATGGRGAGCQFVAQDLRREWSGGWWIARLRVYVACRVAVASLSVILRANVRGLTNLA